MDTHHGLDSTYELWEGFSLGILFNSILIYYPFNATGLETYDPTFDPFSGKGLEMGVLLQTAATQKAMWSGGGAKRRFLFENLGVSGEIFKHNWSRS